MKPIVISEMGVTARIRRVTKVKDGKKYRSYVVRYNHLGELKQVWRADLADAKEAARDACRKTANGETLTENVMTNGERLAYVRAVETLEPISVPIDTACREFAEATKLLAGRATILEVSRDWLKRHTVELPKILIKDAVEKLKEQARIDRKSKERQKQLRIVLDRFAGHFNVYVDEIAPGLISDYLAGLSLAARSKKNHRDVIGHFNRWLVLKKYLPKGTDWLEGVQEYPRRTTGLIEIFTPAELKLLLKNAEKNFLPFLAIGAIAGLRHSEIDRLDWAQVEISKKANDSFIEVLPLEGAKSDQRRRLVPIKDNLKKWLMPYAKDAGKVCPFENSTNKLLELAEISGIEWKHNGLRHSCISYRVAESGDLPRIADESGNSVQIIRSDYLRRVKPAAAKEWFAIAPSNVQKDKSD